MGRNKTQVRVFGWLSFCELGLAIALYLTSPLAFAGGTPPPPPTPVAPANDNWANAQQVVGLYGSVTNSNVGATAEPGETHAGIAAQHSLWYAWTAPMDGDVSLDTFGSVSTNTPLDTVLAVYTGSSSSSLAQVAANDDLFPTQVGANPIAPMGFLSMPYTLSSYLGMISGLRFSATAGTTYYIAVDSMLAGTTVLNWAYHSSGVFRFATEDFSATGTPRFQTSDWDKLEASAGGDFENTEPAGVVVTVTRVAGTCGRMMVNLDTTTQLTAQLAADEQPAVEGLDFIPVHATLVFDDYETVKSVIIPIANESDLLVAGMSPPTQVFNPVFGVVLSQPQAFANESTEVSPPRIDPILAQAIVRINNDNLDPVITNNYSPVVDTNSTPPTTNMVFSGPTNTVFNFGRAHYYLPQDVAGWSGGAVNIRVFRGGTNNATATVYYRVNNYLQSGTDANKIGDFEESDNFFPLTPESDYATPDPATWSTANSLIGGGTVRAATPEFSVLAGTLSFGANEGYKDISLTISNMVNPGFAKDLLLTIYMVNSDNKIIRCGTVDQALVTILPDDADPPAGAVDQIYNADYNLDMFPILQVTGTNRNTGTWLYTDTDPPQNPTPGPDGAVYAVVVQTNLNKTILAGAFTSYNTIPHNGLVRANADGSLDQTWALNDGIYSSEGEAFIDCLVPTSSGQFYIAGEFSSFDGNDRLRVARLDASGNLDKSFNTDGPDDTVRALVVQPDGKVIIGGDFTHVGSFSQPYLARFNVNGSLDTTFNPGTNAPTGPVYALALTGDGRVVAGGNFSSVGAFNVKNLACYSTTNAILDTNFELNLGFGANGTVYTLAPVTSSANLLIGTNLIVTNAYFGKILVGGNFTAFNTSTVGRLVQLNLDGSLDSSFDAGTGADSPIYTLLPQANGTIYVGGLFTQFNGTHRLGFTRLYADGTVDTTFMDTSYNQFAGLHRKYFEKQAAGDPRPYVYACGVQTDGNVLIGGGFNQVGGGQVNPETRIDSDYPDTTEIVTGVEYGFWVARSRDGVRNRANFARLIGGATAGPGNIGFTSTNYSVSQSQGSRYVTIARANGSVSDLSANFSVANGLAQNGVDFHYSAAVPSYAPIWNRGAPRIRTCTESVFGTNTFVVDSFGGQWFGYPDAAIYVSVFYNPDPGNHDTLFHLANPSAEDQCYLGGANVCVGGALGRSKAAFVIVNDNHSPGGFAFSAPSYSVNENAGSLVVPVIRTNGSYGQASVEFRTQSGTAQYNKNLGYVDVILNFASGVTTQYVTVPIYDDYLTTPQGLQATLKLVNANGATLGQNSAALNIVDCDNDYGYVVFSAPAQSNILSGGVATVTVQRIGANQGRLSVDCVTRTNSGASAALPGVNFTPVTNTLVWNNGDATPRAVTVPLINAGVPGANLTFSLALTNAIISNTNALTALASAPANTTVTILNDNYNGTVQFSAPVYRANENAGFAILNVVRTVGSALPLTVNFATTNGTAGSPTNFLSTNGSLTFAAGEVFKSFKVALVNDGRTNPPPVNFSFNVKLSSVTPSGASLGALSNAAVQIVDAQTYNTPSGSADTTFDTSSGFNDNVNSVGIQSNGMMVAGGAFTTYRGYTHNYLIRLGSDASIDSSFLNNLSGPNGIVNAVLVQDNGRILLGGTFTAVNGLTRNYLARLATDGTLDTAFSASASANAPVVALAQTYVNGQRKLLAAGGFTTIAAQSRVGLVRFNDDGTLDSAFNANAILNGPVSSVAVYPANSLYAGKIVIGGAFTVVSGVGRPHVARLNADGTLDTTFDPGSGATNEIDSLALQLDGSVLVGGAFTNFNGAPHSCLVRLLASGAVDQAFALTNGPDGAVKALLVDPDNNIVLGGSFLSVAGLSRSHIARLSSDGTLDPRINFGTGADADVNTLAIQSDGMLLLGGAFNNFNGFVRQHLVRVYGGSISGAGAFEFTAAQYQVNKSAGSAPITIYRTGGTEGSLSVGFVTQDGTAAQGVDYIGISSNLLFLPGQVFQTVTVPLIDSRAITPNVALSLLLTNVASPGSLGNQPQAALVITSSVAGLSFSSPTYTVAENDTNHMVKITVVRTGNDLPSVSVNYSTGAGTAVEGSNGNYFAVSDTLTFGPGETVKSFSIPIRDDGVVRGDVSVPIALANPTGIGQVVSPSSAVLTVQEADGGDVVPAGAALISESGPVNNRLDPNETVTMLLGLRNKFGTPVNLTNVTLLPASGIANIDPASTNYGLLVYPGNSVSRPFTFTVTATNGQTINLSLQIVYGSTTNLANFSFLVGQGSVTFSNSKPIVINDFAPANPYPSVISVAGMGSSVTNASVTLNGLSHTYPADIDMVLVSPSGNKTYLMAKTGANYPITNATISFDDGAAGSVPTTSKILNGTYKPTCGASMTPPFALPLNDPWYPTNLAVFKGTDPTGNWSLYIIDDTENDSGVINNGWALTLSSYGTLPASADLVPGVTVVNASGATAGQSLSFTLSVTNYGPSAASNVLVTNYFRGAGLSTNVVWSVGTLTNGGAATTTVSITPAIAGVLTNTVIASSPAADPVPENNSLATQVSVGLSRPSLAAAYTGNGLVMSWVTNGGNYKLQSATNLAAPVWVDVTNAQLGFDGRVYKITNVIGSGTKFFRLHQVP